MQKKQNLLHKEKDETSKKRNQGNMCIKYVCKAPSDDAVEVHFKNFIERSKKC